MKRVIPGAALAGILALCVLPLATPADAQYALTRWTVDTGGGTLQNGIYALTGTVGQHDAGTVAGGGFLLYGGFWFGSLDVTGVGEEDPRVPVLPDRLALRIGPNPLQRSTTLQWELPSSERVRIAVFDATGRQVALLANETFEAGSHATTWEPEDGSGRLASGIYFVRIEAGREAISNKVMVVH